MVFGIHNQLFSQNKYFLYSVFDIHFQNLNIFGIWLNFTFRDNTDVRKLPSTNPEKRSVSEEPEPEPEDQSVSHVQESHSVFSNLNGNKQGFSKQIEQGMTMNIKEN